MKIFFLRTLFLLFLVFLQISFFDILFSWFRAPLFLLGVVVIFTLVRGFPSALFMTIPLTLLFDTISLGAVTWFSLYAVIFSYGTSFLSRRLLIEHRGMGLGLYALVAYGGAFLYQALFSFIMYTYFAKSSFASPELIPSVESLIFSLVVESLLFVLMYFVVSRAEEYFSHINQQQFRSVR
ncbi:MAG: hypothetical protein Q8O53_00260 [Candidatus Moranbacteria bacterium]|nr:hypothetical protein [Candidatus Moranbacteria bacterium]